MLFGLSHTVCASAAVGKTTTATAAIARHIVILPSLGFQRRWNCGGRFSVKAARPSFASSVAKQIACRSRSYSIALSSGIDTAARRFSFAVSRSEEHTSELQSLLRISYAVFCLKKTKKTQNQ